MTATIHVHNQVGLTHFKRCQWQSLLVSAIAGLLMIFPFNAKSSEIDFTSLQLNGNATTLNTPNGVMLRLTPAKPEQVGSAFTKHKVNLDKGFRTFFTFQITTLTSGTAAVDGLMFVVQSVSPNYIGKPVEGLDYYDPTSEHFNKSVEVEFDTCGTERCGGGETNGNRVSINIHDLLLREPTTAYLAESFNEDSLWYVWIDYNGTELAVRINQNHERPAKPLLTQQLKFSDIFEGSTEAFVGFSAWTGGSASNPDILSWTWAKKPLDIVDKFFYVFAIFLSIHWSLISVYVIFGWLSFLLYKVKTSGKRATHVELVIVSKASESVKASLFDCIQYHLTEFGCDMTVNIVIDEGSDLENQVSQFVKGLMDCRLIIVPNAFQCQAIAKGRAIEYFIRTQVKSRKWYAFIDDDNKVLTDDFLYEIPIYERQGYTCANGVLKPRSGRSKITYIADHLRWFDDLSLFRFGTGLLGKAINGIHGELLLCQGDALKAVSFDRNTMTEDFAFARELIKKDYKFWQSTTVISILSPHGFIDFFRQRNRWYRGLIKDVLTADWKTLLFAGIRLVIWKLSILGSWLLFPLWWFADLPLPIKLFCLVGALHYYTAYFVGIIRLPEKWIRKWYLFLLIPLYSILEAIAPHYKPKQKGFIVIEK